MRDDGGTKYYKLYMQKMKKPENANRELKSIYFANHQETPISLFKLVIHKNSQMTHAPFQNDQIDETNVYNQVSLLAINCLGRAIVPLAAQSGLHNAYSTGA